jgi:hypothetical protein
MIQDAKHLYITLNSELGEINYYAMALIWVCISSSSSSS